MTIDWMAFTPWSALAGGALIGLGPACSWSPTVALQESAVCSARCLSVGLRGVARNSRFSRACWRRRCYGCCSRRCHPRTSLRPRGYWQRPACWSAWARAMAVAAPVAMVFAVFLDCHPVHWWPRCASWQRAFSRSLSFDIFYKEADMSRISGFIAGVLFGMGLLLAGMANPAKVLGFLDLAGQWDPSLGLVMVGAIGVALLPMAWARRHGVAVLGGKMQLPDRRDVDRRLVGAVCCLASDGGWRVSALGRRWSCYRPGIGRLGCSLSRCSPVWRCSNGSKRIVVIDGRIKPVPCRRPIHIVSSDNGQSHVQVVQDVMANVLGDGRTLGIAAALFQAISAGMSRISTRRPCKSAIPRARKRATDRQIVSRRSPVGGHVFPRHA